MLFRSAVRSRVTTSDIEWIDIGRISRTFYCQAADRHTDIPTTPHPIAIQLIGTTFELRGVDSLTRTRDPVVQL